MLEGNKIIITVAVNGGMQQDREGAIIPKQPVEIGEAAARCYEAGASSFTFTRAIPRAGTAVRAKSTRRSYGKSARGHRFSIQTTNGIGVRRDPATGQFIWPTDSERLGLLEISSRGRICSGSPPARPISIIPRAAIPTRRLT